MQIIKTNRSHGESTQKTIPQDAADRVENGAAAQKQSKGVTVQGFQGIEDTVEISAEARNKTFDLQSALEKMRSDMRELRDGLERAREAGEGAAEGWKEKIRCLQIAIRIISGGKVPDEDHRYLRDKDPELYVRAITMRIEKKDPEEYDRLSEDEEDGDGEIAGPSADAARVGAGGYVEAEGNAASETSQPEQ